jgi:predicted dehydrogenase
MERNPVTARLGRRLRLGVVGGGGATSVGEIHRVAARLDDRWEIVASVMSSDSERSRAQGLALNIPADRAYGTFEEMIAAEAGREDRCDALAVMTPNDVHHAQCSAALESGFDLFCDKPMTNSVEEAVNLVHRVRESGLVFCLTHCYAAYPMVRQARAMVQEGVLGKIRLIEAEYLEGELAEPVNPDAYGRMPWRQDPEQTGPSLVLGDLGTHAYNLACYVSGLEAESLCAEVTRFMPGRKVDDNAAMLLRYPNGARGMMWVSQVAAGAEEYLSVRVFGEHGMVEWHQPNPNDLHYRPQTAAAQILTRGGPGLAPAAYRAGRAYRGNPEGYHEAFANLYSDAAEAIVARRTGSPADPLALDFPTVEDGAKGMKMIEAAVKSSAQGGVWTDCTLDL